MALDCSSKIFQINNLILEENINNDRINSISFVYSLKVCIDFVSSFLCMSNRNTRNSRIEKKLVKY